MIDIAWSQFLIILFLAVILLGPKELPLVLRTLGKWFVILRSHVQDLQDYVKAVALIEEAPQKHTVFPDQKKLSVSENDDNVVKDHD